MDEHALLIERFHVALDLWTTAVSLRRQSIRRDRPQASDREIETLLNRWLQDRPGAQHGDGPAVKRSE